MITSIYGYLFKKVQEIQEVQEKCMCLKRHECWVLTTWLYFLYFFYISVSQKNFIRNRAGKKVQEVQDVSKTGVNTGFASMYFLQEKCRQFVKSAGIP